MPSLVGGVATHEAAEPAVKEHRPLRVFLETLIITVAFPAIGYAVDRQDPFFLRHPFSWLAVAPLLIALRHGFAFGFASAMAIDLAITVSWRLRLQHGESLPFPGEVEVGVVALAMIAGQFSDVFRRDTNRYRRGLQTARRRLDALSRAHFLLELSHDRIAQQQAPAAPNLRDAIAAVRKLMGDGGPGKSLAQAAPALLELYAGYFSIEVASLHQVEGGSLVDPPLATIGKPRTIRKTDLLVADAIASRTLTYMPAAMGRGASHHASRVLAAVPFVDTGDSLRGVLTVESMPFIAFDKRNLEAMVVLAGHVADLLSQEVGEERATGDQPGKRDLDLVIDRALSDLRAFNMPAILAEVRIARGSRANDIVDVILGGALREIDFPYASHDPASGDLVVYILLPMSAEPVALTVFDRMARVVQREHGMTLPASGVRVAFHVLASQDTAESAISAVDQRIQENAHSVAAAPAP
jgi:polysaccharide biosynthesis protein PelD